MSGMRSTVRAVRGRSVIAVAAVSIVAGGASLAVAAGGGAGKQRDYEATAAYLRARSALIRAGHEDMPAGRASMEAYVSQVQAECPEALASAPGVSKAERRQARSSGRERQELLLFMEEERGLGLAERRRLQAPIERFAGRVESLSWRDVRITRLVHTLAEVELESLRTPLPNLCGEIEAWAASGYEALPKGMMESSEPQEAVVDREISALGCRWLAASPQGTILAVLRGVESPGAKPGPVRVARMEIKLAVAEAMASAGPLVKLSEALGSKAAGGTEGVLVQSGEIVTVHIRSHVTTGSAPKPKRCPGRRRRTSAPSHRRSRLVPVGVPYRLHIPVPPAVRRAGGRELRQFELGRVVASQAGCEACHRIGHDGNPGPGRDLTHVGSRLSESQIRHAIVDARSPMPSFRDLPHRELKALVKFLALLR